MKSMKCIMCLLFILSPLVQADESTLNQVKTGAIELWDKTKESSKDIASSAVDGAVDIGETVSRIGSETAEIAQDTGGSIWGSIKEAASTTADGVIKSGSTIKEIVTEDCDSESILCFKESDD